MNGYIPSGQPETGSAQYWKAMYNNYGKPGVVPPGGALPTMEPPYIRTASYGTVEPTMGRATQFAQKMPAGIGSIPNILIGLDTLAQAGQENLAAQNAMRNWRQDKEQLRNTPTMIQNPRTRPSQLSTVNAMMMEQEMRPQIRRQFEDQITNQTVQELNAQKQKPKAKKKKASAKPSRPTQRRGTTLPPNMLDAEMGYGDSAVDIEAAVLAHERDRMEREARLEQQLLQPPPQYPYQQWVP